MAEVKELSGGGVDVVVDSVGSTWADSINCLRPGGRVVVFGGTGGGKVELMVRPVTAGQVSLLGTTMGSPRDFAGLLAAVDAPELDAGHRLGPAAGRGGRRARPRGGRRALRQAGPLHRLTPAGPGSPG